MALQPIGPALQVDNGVGAMEREPETAALEGGGYVVTWTTVTEGPGGSQLTDVRYQVFDAAGNEVGPERTANSYTPGNQQDPAVAGLEGGGFVIFWEPGEGQLFNAAGEPVGGTIIPDGRFVSPQVTALEGGGFVLTGHRVDEGGAETYAQVFSANGTPVQLIHVNTVTADWQYNASVAQLEGDGFVIVYQSGEEVRGQVFNDAGQRVGSEFRVNRSTAEEQFFPSVTGLAGGGFVVTWVKVGPSQVSEGQRGEIQFQVFDADGDKIGDQRSVDAGVPGRYEYDPDVTALPDGGFVIGWGLQGEVPPLSSSWLQSFNAQGQATTNPVEVGVPDSGQLDMELTTLANGDVVVAWLHVTNAGDGIYTQTFRYAPDPAPLDLEGTGSADTLTGGGGDDELEAKSGNDSVLGAGGNDEIEGDGGHDTLSGGDGNDAIDGGGSNDSIDGGAGADDLRGDSGRDTLVGGAGADTLRGDTGADRIEGGLGDDRMTGGTGDDVFVFGPTALTGERDLIRDFDEDDDSIHLTGGVTITIVDSGDATGDGRDDTMLHFSSGAFVILSDFTGWHSGLLV